MLDLFKSLLVIVFVIRLSISYQIYTCYKPIRVTICFQLFSWDLLFGAVFQMRFFYFSALIIRP